MRGRGISTMILLLAGTSFGCATTQSEAPTGSLIRARSLHQQAAASPASQHARAELREAAGLLEGAEQEHRAHPRSNMEYHLANLAAAKYEVAMAEGRRRAAEDQYVSLLESRVEEQIARSETEAERQARLEEERRADEALEDLEEEGTTIQMGEEGTTVTVTGQVLFRIGESELLPIARERLEKVAEALKKQGDQVAIVIEGHADATGTDELNDRLSRDRAESVKQFLVQQGIDADRIQAVGRGEREPIATNETPDGRANNRRVEIEIQDEA